MSMNVKFAIVGLIVVFFTGLIATTVWFSYSNGEIVLRTAISAQQKSCETVFDNTWKIISQKCQIADKYKDAFSKIYPELMEGRYKSGGGLMKFVTESNPNFDVSLYKDVMTSIEAQRDMFTREQNKLIDLKREHDNLRLTFPSSVVCGNRPEVTIQIVTSSKTKEAFASGEDNDMKL